MDHAFTVHARTIGILFYHSFQWPAKQAKEQDNARRIMNAKKHLQHTSLTNPARRSTCARVHNGFNMRTCQVNNTVPYAFAVTQTDMCMNAAACLLSRTQHTHTHTQLRIASEDGMAGARHVRAKISLLGLAQAARPWTGSWRRGATATCTKCLRSRRSTNSVSAASAVGARRASGQVFKQDSRS